MARKIKMNYDYILKELNKISEVNINTPTQEKVESGDARYAKFSTALSKIFGVLIVTLQVVSMAGIIFAGVRYMFASADSKADLKKPYNYFKETQFAQLIHNACEAKIDQMGWQ